MPIYMFSIGTDHDNVYNRSSVGIVIGLKVLCTLFYSPLKVDSEDDIINYLGGLKSWTLTLLTALDG